MTVLVACEESQTVCKAFRERGHEAYSCDLQSCSGGHQEWHIKGDATELLKGRCDFHTQDGRWHSISGAWDLVVAHPPCTYLSNAGACRLYPKAGELDMERYAKGLEGKLFFMQFWMYGWLGGRICIENPTPSKVFKLPEWTQTVEPWQFGHPYTKRTRLWLFGLPPLMPTVMESEADPFCPSNTSSKRGGKTYGKQMEHTGKPRSVTFPGIAEAMAEQWGGVLDAID